MKLTIERPQIVRISDYTNLRIEKTGCACDIAIVKEHIHPCYCDENRDQCCAGTDNDLVLDMDKIYLDSEQAKILIKMLQNHLKESK